MCKKIDKLWSSVRDGGPVRVSRVKVRIRVGVNCMGPIAADWPMHLLITSVRMLVSTLSYKSTDI